MIQAVDVTHISKLCIEDRQTLIRRCKILHACYQICMDLYFLIPLAA